MPRLFRVFWYLAPRREPLADRFARVLAAVRRPGDGIARLLFHLADSPVGRVSGVERVVRAFPETASFLFPGGGALGNYPPPWTEHNPARPDGSLAPELLEAILQGVPRRFPLLMACVTFDGVDWSEGGTGLATGPARGDRDPVPLSGYGYLFPSVSIHSQPQVEHVAVVECADPAAALDPITTGKLEGIGRSQRQEVRAGFTTEERAEHLVRTAEADAVVTRFEAELPGWLADRVRWPYALPPDPGRPPTDARFSLKQAVVRRFEPLGYRYVPRESDQSLALLLKSTAGHHVLRLRTDRGTWSRLLLCQFGFGGVEKNHALEVPACPGCRAQYPAGDQAHVDRVVANWAAAVEGLERDLVPRLEAIYGSDPPWFPAVTMGGS